jgi:hypothetical protein
VTTLNHHEVLDRMPWTRAADLAAKYPTSTPEFFTRMLKSCAISGWSVDLAIARYLDGDLTIPVPAEFIAAHRDAMLTETRGFSCPCECVGRPTRHPWR